MIDLADKVTIVTGAAGGIGSQTVRTLAELGARIVATDLPGTGLDDVVTGLTADGFDAIAVEADVTDEDSVRSLIAATIEAHGRVDVVDNNAGATGFAEQDTVVTDMDAAVWDEVFAINARGPMLMCKHTIPHMLEQGGGSIVNISSGLSLAGDVICAAYGPGKAALNTLTRYVAVRLRQAGSPVQRDPARDHPHRGGAPDAAAAGHGGVPRPRVLAATR